MNWLARFTILVAIVLSAAVIAGQRHRPPILRPVDHEGPDLRTEAFENGELLLEDIENRHLERLLQDLNRHKDWDRFCHNGQPGPDNAYLTLWGQRVADELIRRGYASHQEPILYRPDGAVVPRR